jgi:hypothetical protein
VTPSKALPEFEQKIFYQHHHEAQMAHHNLDVNGKIEEVKQ